MTPLDFAYHVRDQTRTNSTTLPDATMLRYMKIRQTEIAQDILKADEDILLIPQTSDLVADQRDYPLPSDILSRIKRVEAKLNESDFIPIIEIDITQIGVAISSETDITDVFNNSQYDKTNNPTGARFDLLRKSVKIYSGTITAVTDGLKVWVNTWPTAIGDLSATDDMSQDPSTTTHGIPRPLHEVWARGVIIFYKESLDKPIPLTERELNYKVDKAEAIQTLRHGNLNREVIGSLPPASERGDNGANY